VNCNAFIEHVFHSACKQAIAARRKVGQGADSKVFF